MRFLALLLVMSLLGFTAFAFGLLTAIKGQIPELELAAAQQPQANSYIYASDGHTVLAVLRGSEARVIVPTEKISPWLNNAFVAIEDKRFYEHRGIDVRGIVRALWSDVRGKAVQGGSTITQQLVKNTIAGNAPTITRKLREAALAWQLEQAWTKDKILTAYLNTIYLDNHAYGVEMACRIYFGHSAERVTPAEAALLAGIPENPSLWDPVAHPDRARERRNLVLLEMFRQHYLTRKQYLTFRAKPLPRPSRVRLPASQGQYAPYFANYVTDQLVSRFGAKAVFGGGLKVNTTIDLALQKIATDTVEEVLPASIGPSVALVTIDRHTGQVLAMVGGRNYHHSQFNLATQGERQPGSSFKPIVLAAALARGIAPSSTLISHSITLNAGGRAWFVDNFEHESLGRIDLNQAIAYSDNTVFAQLTNLVSPASVVAMAHAMGITSPLQPYFSIGLGAEPATPLEMARAYATLANGGVRIDGSIMGNRPTVITAITRGNKEQPNSPVNVPVPGLSRNPSTGVTPALIETDMLRGVVTYGTGTRAQIPGWAVAGKTGTTENYGDAWFVGYTPDLVTAVWVGYPNSLVPMTTEYHGHSVEGGTYPALLWKTYMEKALAYKELRPSSFETSTVPYSAPATVAFRDGQLRIDNGNCKLATTLQFFSGTAPTTTADCKVNEVEVPNVRGITLETARERLTAQPLDTQVLYVPAEPGKRVGQVVNQIPRTGTLSAYDPVKVFVTKAVSGVVPRLVGLSLAEARVRVLAVKMRMRVVGPRGGLVVKQSIPAGNAAGPRLVITVTLRPRATVG